MPNQALQLILDASHEDSPYPIDLSEELAAIEVNFSLVNFYSAALEEKQEVLSWDCSSLKTWMLENFGHTQKGALPARAICFLANQTAKLTQSWRERYQASIPAQDRSSSTVEVQPSSQALQT